MKAFLLLAVGLGITLAATSALAAGRPARCVIDSAGSARWSGPCLFVAERGGSFSVSPQRGSFGDGISVISLYVVSPGSGEVRGLTADGINSRWGPARRATRDRACWIGEDFSLCVY